MTLVSPGSSGAVRSGAAAAGSSAPGTWRGTPQPSTRAGRPPMSCWGPTRTSASGSPTAAARRPPADLSAGRCWRLALLEGLVVVLVDDPQDLDEAEGGSQPP